MSHQFATVNHCFKKRGKKNKKTKKTRAQKRKKKDSLFVALPNTSTASVCFCAWSGFELAFFPFLPVIESSGRVVKKK